MDLRPVSSYSSTQPNGRVISVDHFNRFREEKNEEKNDGDGDGDVDVDHDHDVYYDKGFFELLSLADVPLDVEQ